MKQLRATTISLRLERTSRLFSVSVRKGSKTTPDSRDPSCVIPVRSEAWWFWVKAHSDHICLGQSRVKGMTTFRRCETVSSFASIQVLTQTVNGLWSFWRAPMFCCSELSVGVKHVPKERHTFKQNHRFNQDCFVSCLFMFHNSITGQQYVPHTDPLPMFGWCRVWNKPQKREHHFPVYMYSVVQIESKHTAHAYFAR